MLSYQFRMFNEELWQRDWYLFPIELQRMLVIFMLDTEQSMIIRGYGNIKCTRDAFKGV